MYICSVAYPTPAGVKNKNWQFIKKKCAKFSKRKKKRESDKRLCAEIAKLFVTTRCCKNFWIYNFPDEKKPRHNCNFIASQL